MQANIFLAGAAQIDITPPLGTVINGDFVTHYATFIHDPLYAKALAFQSDGQLFVTVLVDICIMPADFIAEVKQQACQELVGLSPAQLLIASTHTHAAGSVSDVHLTGPDMLYRRKLPGLIVEAIRQSIEKLVPAEVAFGAVEVPEHVLCRRYKMDNAYQAVNPVTGQLDAVKTNPFGGENLILHPVAEVDPQVSYMLVREETSGKYLGLLANYSLHYVGDWENGTISADYFGVFARQVKVQLQAEESFVAMMSNGTSGDINIWDFAGTKGYPTDLFQKSELIGTDIASKLVASVASLQWKKPAIHIRYQEVEVAVEKPTVEEIVAAQQIIQASNYENLVPDTAGLRALYAREQVMLTELPDQVHLPLQVVHFGAYTIGALPGEFFAETGLYLKSNAVKTHFTISMANGNFGYVPPQHEKEKGGYETWRCRYSCLQPNAEQLVRETMLAMINE